MCCGEGGGQEKVLLREKTVATLLANRSAVGSSVRLDEIMKLQLNQFPATHSASSLSAAAGVGWVDWLQTYDDVLVLTSLFVVHFICVFY